MKGFKAAITTTLLCISTLGPTLGHAADQPAPAYLTASAAAKLENASTIIEGATGDKVKSTIYVFMDPNCIFCHYAWEAFQPYEAVGLQVQWIPMGFLKPDSLGKAAALVDSKDSAALLRENEVKFVESTESGGIQPANPVSFTAQSKLTKNIHIFQDMGFDGTPTIIYKTADGRWADTSGMPSLKSLPAMLNLPEQTESASLARFR
jgi:thiol:disulfide interchange protein DsbG